MSLYGAHLSIDFPDLVKIMERFNSMRDGTGRLNYPDFSKWMGNEIHNLASFIFRHDSKRNVNFEMHYKKQAKSKGKDKQLAAEAIMPDSIVLGKLIEKIRQQWSTVRKAFKDFNEDNDPYIDKDELIFFIKHWGFPLTEAQGDAVFNFFDKDGDG